ncbi:UNVERIFIED_CONTAM: hypothetical protein HDU68_011093, partial [Siphonaria sp. JEL0065]
MSDSLPASPDRKRSLDDESSDVEDQRNSRFKRQAVADAAGGPEAKSHSHSDPSGDDLAKQMSMRAIISMKEAGMIIGKNGKNVADIRDSSGAKVTVSENVQGAAERVLTIVGPLDTVAKAFALCVTKIVEEQPTAPGAEDVKQRPLALKVLVPHVRMGSIIGKQGSKIKEIQEASGSKLTATEEILPHSTERIVIVSGVIDSIHIATYHIGAVLQEHAERTAGVVLYKPIPGLVTGQVAPRGSGPSGSSASRSSLPQSQNPNPYGQIPPNPYGYAMPGVGSAYAPYGMIPGAPAAAGGVGPMTPMMPTGAMSVQQIYIPNEMVGAIIGKGGSKINEIRTRTGCNIKIADPVPGATERLITVTGMPEANSMALYMLYQRLEMEKQKVLVMSKLEFSQSAAVARCRNLKESKLKAQQAIAKLADEEVALFASQLEDSRHQLITQFSQQAAVDVCQQREAVDVKISWEHDSVPARIKREGSGFQIKNKGKANSISGAFGKVGAEAGKRESQQRLAETVKQIRAIELKSVKDKNVIRRMARENEIQSQQRSMRQQKESEFLRELQLCKTRQLGELNDLEIINMEEMEEIIMQHRIEEYDFLEKCSNEESEMAYSLERQIFTLEANALVQKQSDVQIALARTQKKQAASLVKSQRAARRGREKGLIADYPIIAGGDGTSDLNVDEFASESDAVSESNGGGSVTGSIQSLYEDEDEKEKGKVSEAARNSVAIKATQVLTEHEKDIIILAETSNERLKMLVVHHKKLLAELKQGQRSTISLKTKEHRRKISELMKDHEEEIEQIKVEQNSSMQDIYEFKKLVGFVSPVKILQLLNVLYTKFDEIIFKYPHLYKVESVADTYMVAAGISSSYEKTDEEISECAKQAFACSIELQRLVVTMDFTTIVGPHPIRLRIGIHSGGINAGVIGTKMSRYCLFGDTINTASRMCTTGEPNKIQVSTQAIQKIGADDEQFEFDERGEIEVKAIAKLADEEVTIFSAQLQDNRHNLSTQLFQQIAVDKRQSSEASDVQVSWERKGQLDTLINKLTAIKKMIMFQQESGEREAAFKSKIREKRSAFQVRLANLEQRQLKERTELLQSQQRMAETVSQIRAIEMKNVVDKNVVRRMKRENEIQSQQASMRQQKESEFLREIQLNKARQLGEVNDLEIRNMEEIEDLTSAHRIEEYKLIEKQLADESDMIGSTARQKFNLEAGLLREKQKDIKAGHARIQRRQEKTLARSQRAAMRAREKILLQEHPTIIGDFNATDNLDDNQSESEGNSESMGSSIAGGSMSSLNEDQVAAVAEVKAAANETEKNSALNKATQVMSEHEKEILALTESGNERHKNLTIHHKKVLAELRQLHRSAISLKTKEHRRKLSELLKDHEEEIEQIKVEQASSMQELLATHLQSEEMRADTAVSQNLLGMMLPAHIMEQIETGVVPGPEQFNCVTVFFTDIYEFKKLVGFVSPVKILQLLNVLYTKFDEVIFKYPHLYKVESVADTYMVAAGISSSHEKTDEETAECAIQALACSIELQKLVMSLDLTSIVGPYPIRLRIGIHSGGINAGVIGTKMSRYCLFGDTINTASRMCTTGEPSKIQVSTQVIQKIGADEQFEFDERGEIEVK